MGQLVVDASIVMAWLFDDEEPRADGVLGRIAEAGPSGSAPAPLEAAREGPPSTNRRSWSNKPAADLYGVSTLT